MGCSWATFLSLPCSFEALIIANDIEREGLCRGVHNKINVRDMEPGWVSSLIGEFSRCELIGWEFLHTPVQVCIADSLQGK